MASPFDLLNPYHQLGMPPTATRADGAGLPKSTTTSIDHGASMMSPDSGAFWLAAVIIITAAGIAGASVKLHAGPVHVAAGIGKD